MSTAHVSLWYCEAVVAVPNGAVPTDEITLCPFAVPPGRPPARIALELTRPHAFLAGRKYRSVFEEVTPLAEVDPPWRDPDRSGP